MSDTRGSTHSSRLKDMRCKKGASACVAATLPKHSARRSAHAAKHLTRRLLCCHELLSIRILMDNNSATILLHTGLDHSIVYKWVVHDTTVASSTRIILHYTCVVHDATVSRITRIICVQKNYIVLRALNSTSRHAIKVTQPRRWKKRTITHAATGAETYYSTHRRMHGGYSGGCRCNLSTDWRGKQVMALISSANAFFSAATSSDSVSCRVSSSFFSLCVDASKGAGVLLLSKRRIFFFLPWGEKSRDFHPHPQWVMMIM
jgi:hypothetical protein